jgi:hypothetical protein
MPHKIIYTIATITQNNNKHNYILKNMIIIIYNGCYIMENY